MLTKKRRNDVIIAVTASLLILVAIILAMVFFTRGKTQVTGDWTASETTSSFTCEAKNIEYPVLSYGQPSNTFVRINAKYNDDGPVSSISILYTATYANEEVAIMSYNHNGANLNTSFAKFGLQANAFSNHLSQYGNQLSLSMYSEADALTNQTAEAFFLLKDSSLKSQFNMVVRGYRAQGFDCDLN